MNVVVEKGCHSYVMDTPVCYSYKTELDQLLVFHVTSMVMTQQAFSHRLLSLRSLKQVPLLC